MARQWGIPPLDVAYFRMDMHLRGIREAADIFLNRYEAGAGRVQDLGFWGARRRRPPTSESGGLDPRREANGQPWRDRSKSGPRLLRFCCRSDRKIPQRSDVNFAVTQSCGYA